MITAKQIRTCDCDDKGKGAEKKSEKRTEDKKHLIVRTMNATKIFRNNQAG